ncbi:restriction endonuclease subunit S [Vibrio parahaemolyticus]|uniref:restriction endonuclease subunit S n=1 Tax=Vibrio parahaemolyticus TaxID=670 RepID=UPI0022B469C5|nr:restriction endonuclease subunit S [Vibrio parahaemolyticus]MCZ6247803.1 restriction endonuclease subunit S [Vibrio parahaemolyticus]WHP48691.1 restriction endonuclease subunit S [Vibrio parahaemolyticus]
MSKLEPRKLVPELRFSEFRESEGWNQKTVKDIFSIFQGYAFSSTDSVATGVRWLKIADVDIQKMNHDSPSFLPKHYEGEYGKFLVKKNDYVMALTRPILGGKLKIARVDDVFNGALLNQRVGKLVAEENSTFVYYLIQTSQLVSDIERSIAGSEPPNLSSQQIKDIKTYIPSDEREIEKISECLSSMDDLITANSQKLESLKLHKKGLMQNLFPDEGKSTPELGFTCNVKWNKKTFEEVYSLKTTNSLSRDKLNYDDGLVKNIHYGDIHTKFSTLFDITKESVPFINAEIALDKVKEESYCQEGDMVFADASEDIDDVGKSIELINLNGEKLLSGLHTILARQKGSYLVKGFGGYLFKSEVLRKQIQKESQGAKVLGISATRISKIDVVYPIEQSEQQRIVDCLSSLDKLIDTQTKKIEILNIYKKGLMQQLFPEIKEAIA